MNPEQRAQHKELGELATHLDEHLSQARDAEPDWFKWSDGDKLRGFAHSQLMGQDAVYHMGLPMDFRHVRELMRMAARLDVLDEIEMADAGEEEG